MSRDAFLQRWASLRATSPRFTSGGSRAFEKTKVINVVWGTIVTSHIFLSLKYDKGISSVGLLLLVGFFVRVSISNNTNLHSVSTLFGLQRIAVDERAQLGQTGQTPVPSPVHQRRSSVAQQSES